MNSRKLIHIHGLSQGGLELKNTNAEKEQLRADLQRTQSEHNDALVKLSSQLRDVNRRDAAAAASMVVEQLQQIGITRQEQKAYAPTHARVPQDAFNTSQIISDPQVDSSALLQAQQQNDLVRRRAVRQIERLKARSSVDD